MNISVLFVMEMLFDALLSVDTEVLGSHLVVVFSVLHQIGMKSLQSFFIIST